MSHEHPLVCGACGNELRSVAETRCTHCGALDPLNAKPEHAHPEAAGDKEVPRTFAGATREQLQEFLSGPVLVPGKEPQRGYKERLARKD